MTEKVIIAKNLAYAAKTGGGTVANIYEVDLLEDNAVAIFDDNNGLVTAATTLASLEDNASFTVVTKIDTGSGKTPQPNIVRMHGPIPRNAYNMTKQVYRAPVKHVLGVGNDQVTVGAALNYPTFVPGEVFSFRVNVRNTLASSVSAHGGQANGLFMQTKMFIEIPVAVGETAVTMTNKAVAAVNAHPGNQGVDKWVTAAALGGPVDGFSLTAQDFWTVIEVGLDYGFRNSSLNTIAAMVTGDGYVNQVTEDEFRAAGYLGKVSHTWLEGFLWDVNSQLPAGQTGFDTYTFEWYNKTAQQASVMNAQRNRLSIKVPTGVGLVATLDTIFGLLSLTPANDITSPGDNV